MAGTDPTLPNLPQPTIIVEDADPLIGLNLSGFIVTRLLASGGMGLVYLAEHETIGRRAAVKVLRPEVAADAEWTRRFLTEARALASLKHRNLIEVLNFGKTPDGRQYLMMEFLEGEPLDAYMGRIGALAPANALAIADQVLNGLAEAHKKGVVHRDLKPSNVFLLREHNGELLVKVIDFGLARQEPIALLTEGVVNRLPFSPDGSSLLAGTPEYIAPEQARGQKVDGSADLYSLGVLLFEMLAGELPFESDTISELLQMHVSKKPPAISSLVNNLPEGIEEFVDALLEKDPLKRPPSADAARVTCQRLVKRMAVDATAVRLVDPKQLPTMKIDRTTMPVSGGPLPKPLPLEVRAPASTDQELLRAFPQRSRWPAVVVAVVALLLLFAAWWLFAPAAATVLAPIAEAPPSNVAPPPAVTAEATLEPAPVADPAPDDLAPVAAVAPVGLPPPAKVVVVRTPEKKPAPGARGSVVVVEAKPCAPDARWKSSMSLNMQELDQLAARDARVQREYDKVSGELAKYLTAQTCGDRAQVEEALDLLEAKIQAPRK